MLFLPKAPNLISYYFSAGRFVFAFPLYSWSRGNQWSWRGERVALSRSAMRLISTVLIAHSGPKSRLRRWRAFRGQPWGYRWRLRDLDCVRPLWPPLSPRATLHPLSSPAPPRDDLGARSPRLPCLLPSVLDPTLGGSREIRGCVEREGGAFGPHVSLLGLRCWQDLWSEPAAPLPVTISHHIVPSCPSGGGGHNLPLLFFSECPSFSVSLYRVPALYFLIHNWEEFSSCQDSGWQSLELLINNKKIQVFHSLPHLTKHQPPLN